MEIHWVWKVFVCSGLLIGSWVTCTDWVDHLMSYIDKDVETRQVKLITRLAAKEKIRNAIGEELIAKTIERFPTRLINLPENEDQFKKSGTFGFTDTEATFYIILHESHDVSTVLPPKILLDMVAEIAVHNYHPKYLLLLNTRELAKSLEAFLEYAWRKKLLDLTIVEVVEPPVAKNWRSFQRKPTLPVVHQLNPFKNSYKRVQWTRKIEYFPRKVNDMSGYPLRILAAHFPPFSTAVFNEAGRPVLVEGVNWRILGLIAKHLNTSLLPLKEKTGNAKDAVAGIFNSMKVQNLDFESILTPQIGAFPDTIHRTTAVRMEQFCAIVPILTKSTMPVPVEALETYTLCLCVFMIFFVVKQLLKLEARLWSLFYIGRVLFGIGVGRQPVKVFERLIFTTLMLFAAIYSSMMYSSITEMSLNTDTEIPFDSWEDLDNSGLIPMVSPFSVTKAFNNATGALLNLKNKHSEDFSGKLSCVEAAVKFNNVSCFAFHTLALWRIKESTVDGRPTMKLAKPCFFSDGYGFIMGKGSPYRYRVNEIVERLRCAGIIDYHFRELSVGVLTTKPDITDTFFPNKTDNEIQQQLLHVIVGGLVLSTVVFFAEIIFFRVSKYMRSRKRRLRPIRPMG